MFQLSLDILIRSQIAKKWSAWSFQLVFIVFCELNLETKFDSKLSNNNGLIAHLFFITNFRACLFAKEAL